MKDIDLIVVSKDHFNKITAIFVNEKCSFVKCKYSNPGYEILLKRSLQEEASYKGYSL